MQLTCDAVFYEVQKLFPNATMSRGYNVDALLVEGLAFWGPAERMGGRIVLIGPDEATHIAHRCPPALYVLADEQLPTAASGRATCIALGERAPLGAVFNRLEESLGRYRAWEAALERAVSGFASYDAIVRSCDPMLHAPLALMDDQYHYVSYSKQLAHESGYEDLFVDGNGYLPLEYINAATSTPRYKDSLAEQDVYRMAYLENGLHKNVFCDGRFIGRLTLPYGGDEAENAFSAFVLRCVCGYVERLYAVLGTFYRFRTNDTRLQGVLVGLLRGQDPEQGELESLLANRGFRAGDRYFLVQFTSNSATTAARLGDALGDYLSASWPGCFGFTFEDRTLMLANATYYARGARREFAGAMAYFLRESLLVAGLSRAFDDVREVRAALDQTDIALACGRRLDPTEWFPKFDDYALWHLLHYGSHGFAPHQVCDPALLVLQGHDRAHGTQLLATLRAYQGQRYNAVAAARELHLSRSAFLKRLARIEELTAVNLDDARRRLYLALSFELLDEGPA